MSKLVWLTDLHLDHAAHMHGNERIVALANSIAEQNPDGVLITGDISNAKDLVTHLSMLEAGIKRQIMFVLGNHDYWNGSIESVRSDMRQLGGMSPLLRYLPTLPYIPFGNSAAVVGHDCWYDAFAADPMKSSFVMNDWYMTKEFREFMRLPARMSDRPRNNIKNMQGLVEYVRKLAREGVEHIAKGIKAAVRYYKHVIVLSHPPAYRSSHIHNGSVGDDNSAPWYVCNMLGDVMSQASQAYPNVKFTLLSGHTHGHYSQTFKNLSVNVGGANYGAPQISGVFDV